MSAITLLPVRRLALVADDETVIQDLVVRVMRQFGLVTLSVSNGAAAIAAVEAHRDDLACAVLDVVMPIVNGVDAAHAIQRIAPELAIVLMSGAVPAECAEPLKRLRLAGMLHKPFLLAELRELIHQAIGGAVAIEPA
jgi:CheY-like chemotaxis protein